MSLNQIHNKSLREQVLGILRDAILNGDFKPGQAIVETELATQLGVSRAPIREALQRLNSEGLLEMVPYHPTVVKRLNKKDIEELYSLRIVLETFAVQRLLSQEPMPDLSILNKLYADMMIAADAGNLKEVNALDRQFHETLISLSQHSLLLNTWNGVAMRIRQVMALRNMRNSDITQIARNHLPIIRAIEACDEALSLELLKQHISSAGDLIVNNWIYQNEQEDDEAPW